MPRSKSRRSKVNKVVDYKPQKTDPVDEDELNKGFNNEGIKNRRENQQPRGLFKLSKRHGHAIRHSTAKRTIKVDADDKAKKPIGSTRKTRTLNHDSTRLRSIANPGYRQPTPKKKSCCERWFGRDAGKKKCKKKCKTRKKKKKSKTRKKKKKKKKKKKE